MSVATRRRLNAVRVRALAGPSLRPIAALQPLINWPVFDRWIVRTFGNAALLPSEDETA